jgi:hypothetical protein
VTSTVKKAKAKGERRKREMDGLSLEKKSTLVGLFFFKGGSLESFPK